MNTFIFGRSHHSIYSHESILFCDLFSDQISDLVLLSRISATDEANCGGNSYNTGLIIDHSVNKSSGIFRSFKTGHQILMVASAARNS
jgi:hypothetical protein